MDNRAEQNLRAEAVRLATAIADDLFVSGSGQPAERLVLTSKEGSNLGGWYKAAVVDRVLDLLLGKG